MAASAEMTQFVRDALIAGRSRDEIRGALDSAGWSAREVGEALEAFADTPFTPPVPRPRMQLTARDAFTYAILFTALGFTSVYFVSIVHALLDLALPDTTDGDIVASYTARRIRWAIAILVVSTPVYLWLTAHTNRRLAADPGQRRSLVRKWLTYLALFFAALTFLGDITVVIYSFLTGEATLRFLLKAAVVAAVAAAIFAFYLGDVEDRGDAR